MLTMRTFYDRLFQAHEELDAYLQCLARLTSATVADVAAISGEMEWTGWYAQSA